MKEPVDESVTGAETTSTHAKTARAQWRKYVKNIVQS